MVVSFGEATIKNGDVGADVTKLQNMLGVTTELDFGSDTEAAVRNYQASRKLTVDGIVGPDTWAALNKEFGGGAAPSTVAVVSAPKPSPAPSAPSPSNPSPAASTSRSTWLWVGGGLLALGAVGVLASGGGMGGGKSREKSRRSRRRR